MNSSSATPVYTATLHGKTVRVYAKKFDGLSIYWFCISMDDFAKAWGIDPAAIREATYWSIRHAYRFAKLEYKLNDIDDRQLTGQQASDAAQELLAKSPALAYCLHWLDELFGREYGRLERMERHVEAFAQMLAPRRRLVKRLCRKGWSYVAAKVEAERVFAGAAPDKGDPERAARRVFNAAKATAPWYLQLMSNDNPGAYPIDAFRKEHPESVLPYCDPYPRSVRDLRLDYLQGVAA